MKLWCSCVALCNDGVAWPCEVSGGGGAAAAYVTYKSMSAGRAAAARRSAEGCIVACSAAALAAVGVSGRRQIDRARAARASSPPTGCS